MTKLPQMMSAIKIEGGRGPASALILTEMPVPHPNDGEVLIRVEAAGVNRPDVFQRMGFYPPPPGASATLGLEVAGEIVVAAGRWKVGDKVCALLGGGGYADYAVADARHVLPAPPSLDVISASALPETVFTVFANVFEDGRLRPGETLLLHGATSGIGTTAIQMAKAAGAKVIATRAEPRRRRPRSNSVQTSPSTPKPTTLPRSRRPTAAPMSCLTWSAATISRATSPRSNMAAASSTSLDWREWKSPCRSWR